MINLALLHHYNWGRRRKRWYRRSFGGSYLQLNYSIVEITVIFNIILLLCLKPSNAIAPKYETAYACEGKTLAIECENGNLINLIRANYGRFSITICNDHGNTDWSVNCMSPKSLRVLHSKCAHKQNCSVLASTNMFGDPCPGTHKYLEAHYLCLSEASQQTTTTNTPTTNRLNPPWILTSQPSIWSTSTVRYQTTSRIVHLQTVNTHNTTKIVPATVTTNAKIITTTPSSTLSRNKDPVVQQTTPKPNVTSILPSSSGSSSSSVVSTTLRISSTTQSSTLNNSPAPSILTPNIFDDISTQSSVIANTNTIQKENYFCQSRMARNLFWNTTRVGEINVQPCPGGATGLAKWRCVFDKIVETVQTSNVHSDTFVAEENFIKMKPVWQSQTPDLTLCRSLWLNSLEIRVKQRDSSLISIANDLSQVTSSKTLYGGDMLVTTKIIQTMSEKMTYDIETFPDQRQREAIVYELLLGVVKTGSNLLDQSQHLSWLDLSFEDQMRVATSLLTGLEDNAFLLAETIVRERNVVQKVKNILLSVRVLETRNIVGNEIFPDSNVEQWNVSDDRIELPRGALIENSDGGLVRIVFVAFDRLESILRPTNIMWSDSSNQNYNNKYSKNNSLEIYTIDGTHPPYVKKRILNSKVISASLGKGRHIQLSQPIRLVLKHLKTENVTNPSCVFWNYIDHAWSEDGCYVEQTNDTHTICTCNHLTNFAILMDIVDEKLSETYKLIDDKILILIYISIAICIIFIIIAILTLKLFNGIFIKSNRTTIYKNLYMCLLTIEILFLIGIELNEIHVLCGFTSAFLHCSFLCAIAWIFFEGFQLYVMLTTDDMLLDGEKTSKTIWYYLLTYGLSFTIVAIALWINPNTYTQADYCIWMEKNNIFYFTFLAPIIFFILANLVYSAMAFFIMCKKYKTSLKNKEHTRLASVRFYLRCSVIFLIIFTGVWTFGYLYMESIKFNDSSDTINPNIYGYIFVILNSFQGIFIFVFHFIQNDKVRHEYYKLIRQNKWLPKCFKCNKANNNNNNSNNINSNNNNITSTQTNSPNSQNHDQGDSGNCVSNTINNRTIKPNRSQISSTSSISINSSNLIYNTNNGNNSNNNNNSNNDWNYLQQGGGGAAVDSNLPTSFTTLNHHHIRNKTLSKSQMGSGIMTGTLNLIGQPQAGTVSTLNQDDCYYWTNHSNNNSNINNNTLGNTIYPSYKKKIKYPYDTSTMNPSSHHQQQSSSDCQFLQSRTLNPPTNQFLYKFNYLTDHQSTMHQQQPPPPPVNRNLLHHPHIISGESSLVGAGGVGASGLVQVPGSNVDNSSNYFDEPVYEEIVSNRPNYDDYVDDEEIEINRRQQQHQRRVAQQQIHRRHNSNNFNPNELDASDDDDDDDEDDDDDDDDENEDDDLEDFGNEDEDLIDENYRIRDMLSSTRDNRIKKLKYAYPSTKSQPINDIQPIEELQAHQAPTTVSAAQQQQQFGRNLSAILDENNTVICYLEPISKN